MSCLQNRSPQLLKYARLFNYGGFARLSSAATSSTEVMRREKLVSANNYEPLPVVITRGEGEIKTTNDFLGGGVGRVFKRRPETCFFDEKLEKRPSRRSCFVRTDLRASVFESVVRTRVCPRCTKMRGNTINRIGWYS